MTRFVLSLALSTATFFLALPAHANLLTRTFVSAAGSDSNPCTISQPCATFAHAYSLTAANGIIAALDPGKYGPLTITGPITINGNGWAAVTAPAAGNGFTITAGASDNVALIGLEIDGAGAAYDGINFQSGGSLTVTNCVVQNFIQDGTPHTYTGNGIIIQPTSGTVKFTITGTTASNNAFVGVYYSPPSGTPVAHGIVDHLTATNNQFGVSVNATSVTGGSTSVIVANSIASNNSITGISAGSAASPPAVVAIHNVTAANNGTDGISTLTGVQVLLGHSVVKGNQTEGIFNFGDTTVYTYGTNQINLNGPTGTTDISGTALNTTFTPR